VKTATGLLKQARWSIVFPARFLVVTLVGVSAPLKDPNPSKLGQICLALSTPVVITLWMIEDYHPALSYAVECTFHQAANGRCLGVDMPVPLAIKAEAAVALVYGILVGVLLDYRRLRSESA
jgi:hypothetical protein